MAHAVSIFEHRVDSTLVELLVMSAKRVSKIRKGPQVGTVYPLENTDDKKRVFRARAVVLQVDDDISAGTVLGEFCETFCGPVHVRWLSRRSPEMLADAGAT